VLAEGDMEQRMPLARYFSFVGGVLLALLLILDASFPKRPVVARPEVYPPVIRIHTDWKWPERIVYDTNLPTIVPTSVAGADIVAPASEKTADASADASEQQAFAMLPSSAERSQSLNAKK
jgi:hypothetical protein